MSTVRFFFLPLFLSVFCVSFFFYGFLCVRVFSFCFLRFFYCGFYEVVKNMGNQSRPILPPKAGWGWHSMNSHSERCEVSSSWCSGPLSFFTAW